MKVSWGIMLLVLLLGPPALARNIYQVAEARPDADGVQRLEVIADSYFFKPNYLVVKAGVPVELTIRRLSWLVPHDFVLKITEADIDIRESIASEGTRIRFTPTVEGRFPFYCSKRLLFFKSHREEGMEGVLEIKR